MTSPPGAQQPEIVWTTAKSRVIAALLALFLGALGLHKFYLGKVVLGIIYIVFSWTAIPSIVGWIEGISYLATSDAAWAQQYGGPVVRSNGVAVGCLWVVALWPVIAIFTIFVLLFLGGAAGNVG